MNDGIADLVSSLRSADVSRRTRAAERLSRIGEAAGAAAIPLVQSVGDADETVREWAVAALEEMGPPSPSQVGGLVEQLDEPHPDVGYWAATLLGRLGTEASTATQELASAVAGNPHTAVQERAAWALGEIGPPAEHAIPVLEQAAQSTNARLARLAQRALKQIRT